MYVGTNLNGEQTYWRNQILDKLSKTVLGQNVEKNIQNRRFGTKRRILPNSAKS